MDGHSQGVCAGSHEQQNGRCRLNALVYKYVISSECTPAIMLDAHLLQFLLEGFSKQTYGLRFGAMSTRLDPSFSSTPTFARVSRHLHTKLPSMVLCHGLVNSSSILSLIANTLWAVDTVLLCQQGLVGAAAQCVSVAQVVQLIDGALVA